MDKIVILRIAIAVCFIGIISCSTPPKQITVTKNPNTSKKQMETLALQGDSIAIWHKLQLLSLNKLNAYATVTTLGNDLAWIKLAIIGKQSNNTQELLTQLMAWRAIHPKHPGNSLFPDNNKLITLTTAKPKKNVTLLLPLQGPLGSQGQAVRDGYLSAYYDTLNDNHQEQIISFVDTHHENLTALYQKAVASGADIIIGPLTKPQVEQLSADGHYPVTTLALNYSEQTTPDPHFFQFGLSQKDEAEQLAEKAFKSGKSRAIIIASEETWSQNIVRTLTERWGALGGKMVDSYYYTPKSPFTKDIAAFVAEKQQNSDVIFLVALPQAGREIAPLLKHPDRPVYSTSLIYSGIASPEKDVNLNGVIFCDIPWVLNNPSKTQHNRLYAVGRDAELLSNELERLALLPHFPLQAATGLLSLNTKQQIYRQVLWTEMHAGHP